MGTEHVIPEWKTSIDEVWATLNITAQMQKENAEMIKAMGAETDRRFKKTDEQLDRTDRQLEKNAKAMEDLKKTVDRIGKNVGGLNRSLGELVETLIAARLWEKFPKYNLKRAYQRMPIFDESNRVITDIDILLSDTAVAMAVEVKREFNKKDDVNDHLQRMEFIKKYPPAEVIGKELLGAMAGGIVDPDVQRYAYEKGFYVLELTGESVHLIPPPDGFEPRKW